MGLVTFRKLCRPAQPWARGPDSWWPPRPGPERKDRYELVITGVCPASCFETQGPFK